MEVDGKLCIVTHASRYVVYIFIYMCHTFIIQEWMEEFTDST